MKVLVLGSGGREHALCYVLARSSLLKKLYCLPGNGGISEIAEIPQGLTLTDFEGIKEFCLKEKIDLVIPGPEDPLVRGIRDYLQRENISVFGPDKYTAQLEGSKAFAKGIMEKAGVPTADFKVFEDYNEALEYLRKKGLLWLLKQMDFVLEKVSLSVIQKQKLNLPLKKFSLKGFLEKQAQK